MKKMQLKRWKCLKERLDKIWDVRQILFKSEGGKKEEEKSGSDRYYFVFLKPKWWEDSGRK